jgi:hypothetical protein
MDVILVGALEVMNAPDLNVGHPERGAGNEAASEPPGEDVLAATVEEGPSIHPERICAAVHLVGEARLIEETLRDGRDEPDPLLSPAMSFCTRIAFQVGQRFYPRRSPGAPSTW